MQTGLSRPPGNESPLIVALLLVGAACQAAPEARHGGPAAGEEPEHTALDIIGAQPENPATGLVLIDSADLHVESHGRHRVELRVQAEQWPDGRVLWEHAHRWVLLTRASDGVFVLLDELVPHGQASFLVVESDGGPVVISETQSGTAGVRMAAFVWDPAGEGYRQVSEIRVDGSLRHRTPSEAYEQ